ncbi:hypothetical protein B0H10DRAFT_1951913 [Mycena sp. CBHHK59/15]|nr:hypothetical protein B0H10DRAFT_1951913 [Mycena sp. CBHHK59/15]
MFAPTELQLLVVGCALFLIRPDSGTRETTPLQSEHGTRKKESSHPDIDDAAAILHEFLSTLILSVQKEIDGELKDVMKKDHKAACADAAIQAHETVTPSKPSPADPYSHPAGVDVHAAAAAHTALDEVDRRSRYADEDHRCTPS